VPTRPIDYPTNQTAKRALNQMSNTRRAASTCDQYRRKVLQLQMSAIGRKNTAETFTLRTPTPDECSNLELLHEFRHWSIGKKRSTWDLYRAAVLWHMRAVMDVDPSESNRKIYEEMNAERCPEPSKRLLPEIKAATSIPLKDLNKLIDELLSSNQASRNRGVQTQCWLLAALATGLRPNEWEHANLKQMDGGQWVLHVLNSKRKVAIPAHMELKFYQDKYPHLNIKNRFDIEALGFENVSIDRKMTREIPISDRDLSWVQNHLAAIEAHIAQGESFDDYYQHCRQALYRACLKVFDGKKRYTLYVMRHQFAANIKNKYPKERVADLMGHDCPESAPKDYASRSKGYPEFRQYRNAQTTPPESHSADAGAPVVVPPSDADQRQVQN